MKFRSVRFLYELSDEEYSNLDKAIEENKEDDFIYPIIIKIRRDYGLSMSLKFVDRDIDDHELSIVFALREES